MCAGCTGKRKAQSDVALVKETPPAVQSPEVTDDTLAAEEPDTETSTDNPPRPVAMVLEPVVRDIPVGRPLSADSLSMRTEYDYYPVATSKVKVFITNRANQKYDSGERYSLVYYNEALKQCDQSDNQRCIVGVYARLSYTPADYSILYGQEPSWQVSYLQIIQPEYTYGIRGV